MEKGRGGYNNSRDCDFSQSNGGVNRMQNRMGIDDVTSSADLSSISLYSDVGYIEHPVSKFDTLVGIAIKYGVEVSDIKRMNALVTDHQMFALKSLQIPTPGKHPSPHLSEDLDISRKSNCEQNSTQPMPYNLLGSFQSVRIKSSPPKAPSQAHRIHHRKSRSFANGFPFENIEFTDIVTAPNGSTDSTKGSEKLVRRRQKSMADFSVATESLFKKTNTSNGECLSMTGKILDVRLKGGAERSNEVGNKMTPIFGNKTTPILMYDVGDSFMSNGVSGGRRSSSTCNLQEAEKGSSSFMWSSSSWNLKTDIQAFSSARATKSIFDGLPKPTTTRYKASRD